jgi:hypothetical protein
MRDAVAGVETRWVVPCNSFSDLDDGTYGRGPEAAAAGAGRGAPDHSARREGRSSPYLRLAWAFMGTCSPVADLPLFGRGRMASVEHGIGRFCQRRAAWDSRASSDLVVCRYPRPIARTVADRRCWTPTNTSSDAATAPWTTKTEPGAFLPSKIET